MQPARAHMGEETTCQRMPMIAASPEVGEDEVEALAWTPVEKGHSVVYMDAWRACLLEGRAKEEVASGQFGHSRIYLDHFGLDACGVQKLRCRAGAKAEAQRARWRWHKESHHLHQCHRRKGRL